MRYIKSYNNTADLRIDLVAGELGNPYVAKVNNTIDFNSISTNWENEYFTIIALTDGSIRYNHKDGSNPMFFSINESEWIETTAPVHIPVSKNDMIRFKSNRGNRAYDNNKGTFTSEGTAQFAVAGNLMSLVAGDGFATYVPYTSATGSNGDLYRSFRYFFKNCTGLISAKNLIIKYCDNYAFREFFNGCTNLLMPPELPATTLANYCYSNMFRGCTSLTTAPKLPATTLAQSCYQNMFNGCTSLTKAPKLPATTLADYCYSNMFYGTNVLPDCSNIDFASSTVVASGGLRGLFAGTKVTDNDLERLLPKNDNGKYYLPATTLADACYSQMFSNCTSLITATELPATTLANGCYNGMFYNCTSLTTAPALPATTLANNCYDNMFYKCTSLTTAPELPVTTLANYCYSNMFRGCTSLTTAPKLPATTLADSCYSNMFYGTNVLPDCSNIDFASSTVVASGGLKGLFAGTKVTDNDLERLLPKNDNGRYYLPVTTLADACYSQMFNNCTSLKTAPELPATTLAQSCYSSMFWNCTSLTTAPELPATTLAQSCYRDMFYNCASLNYIKCLATNISAPLCTSNWVSGVASTGTFVKNTNMSSWTTDSNGIPSGWTVIDA